MVRTIVVTVFLSIICTLSGFSQNNVDIVSVIPENIDAGSEFLIHVNIKKEKLGGIARFQMGFPNGFEVIEKKSANGEFRFHDQTLIVQWLKLPLDEEIDLTFSVKVNPTMEGFFVLKGVFNYIEGNEKKLKELYPHIITVKPIKQDEKLLVVNKDNNYQDISNVVKDEISCIRQKPSLDDNNEITINLLITKGSLTKFGKLQEQIPIGYKAVSVASKSAIFVFNQKSRIVKYMWMNLPAESQFKVQYKLIPIGSISDEPFIIHGKFIYAENNTTKETDVVERNIKF
jgi:hypothetical protein